MNELLLNDVVLYFTIILLSVYVFLMVVFIVPFSFLWLARLSVRQSAFQCTQQFDGDDNCNIFCLEDIKNCAIVYYCSPICTCRIILKNLRKLCKFKKIHTVQLIDVYFFTTSIKLTIKYESVSFEKHEKYMYNNNNNKNKYHRLYIIYCRVVDLPFAYVCLYLRVQPRYRK